MKRYYYKDQKNNFMILKHPLAEPLEEGISASSEEEYQESMRQAEIKEASDPKRGILKEMAELKWNLSSTDYKAIKYAEGVISEEEYAPIKEQRQAWRARINEIESLLGE